MEETESTEVEEKKKSKIPLILGLVLAVAGGGGGFYATQSGMIFGTPSSEGAKDQATKKSMTPSELPEVAFVAIEPVIIPVKTLHGMRHLKFSANLEVPKEEQANVEALLPRAVDIFNGYLRAVEIEDLEDPTSLIMIRSHLLHRAKLVIGAERINNLLIMEFILS